MSDPVTQRQYLWQYFLLTYALVLVNVLADLWQVQSVNWLTGLFLAAAFLTYSFLYVLPAMLLTMLLRLVMSLRLDGRLVWPASRVPAFIVYAWAVLCACVTQVILYADTFTYGLYGFHLDGFVLNLVLTPGGLESMGSTDSTKVSFALRIGGIVAIQVILLVLVVYLARLQRVLRPLCARRTRIALVTALVVLGSFQALTYGFSTIRGYAPVLVASRSVPFYISISLRKFGRKLGLEVPRDLAVKFDADKFQLRYPAQPIQRKAPAKPYNIVWLVAESLREDMVDPEIMPRTHQFAMENQWFRQHYSGGNGTRQALFAMFYGLYSPYWFSFLALRRGPVLFDLLAQDGYQLQLYTSAKFSYPEFDQTVFASVPSDRLHQNDAGETGWMCDRHWVGDMMKFIDARDPAKPFMTFMFFESPHAPYSFPPQCAIRKPYLENMNYATMDLKRDGPLIKNRYINCCNHLDSQWARLIDFLRERKLLDSTIVVMTGDHGEEFMEKGRWGHNSTFSEEQLRTPLVLRVPGAAARQYAGMTSHMDLPLTVLRLLGVSNPPADIGSGMDLLDPGYRREFCVAGDWHSLTVIDRNHKAILPVQGLRFGAQYTTKDDLPADSSAARAAMRPEIIQVLNELHAFGR